MSERFSFHWRAPAVARGLAQPGSQQEVDAPPNASSLIQFGAGVNPEHLTPYSRSVLERLARDTGVTRLVITSLYRSPEHQARIMFNNLRQFGVKHGYRLYGVIGDKVIDSYVAAKAAGGDDDTIRKQMAARIRELGAHRVSVHCWNPQVRNAIDVSPRRLEPEEARTAWVAALRQLEATLPNSRVWLPPKDPAYHIEIPQPPEGSA